MTLTLTGFEQNWERLRDAALEAARRAGEIQLHYFDNPDLQVFSKADASPVTAADRESEQVVREILGKRTPEVPVHGEEYGASGETAPPARWIVDPIDATRNFIRGLPQFACLIGLEVEGECVLGVVHTPADGSKFYWAARGHGAWRDGQRLRVSDRATLAESDLVHGVLRGFVEFHGGVDGLVRLATSCRHDLGFADFWGHLLVAEGKKEIMADPAVEAWDIAAIAVIVTEAGGTFTSLRGEPGITHGSALSTNGRVHAPALRKLLGAT